MTIEDILCETGGFGRFQLFVVLGVGLTRFTIGWSMLQMTYVGMVPDWYCLGPNSTQPQNGSLNACSVPSSESTHEGQCASYHFVSSSLTIINEWTLVCDLSWVKPAVVCIQMTGVLLGALLAGQLGDSLGRKKTLYALVLEHVVLNFIAAFSVTWQMFAVCRFFIGVGIGGVLVCSFPFPLEFLPLKWRPFVSVLPFWSVGICVFSLASSFMHNWSNLHITCGVLSLPGLFVYFFLPESLRWLTVHDRMEEAHDLVMKMAVVNGKLQPRKASITLQAVAWEEQKLHEDDKRYTYLDLFKEWLTTQTTLIFCFHWFCLSLVYYAMSFGVSSMAASVPVNIFLLAVFEIPARLATFYFDNKIGRRWTSIAAVAVSCASIFICLIVQLYAPETSRATIITVLYLLARTGTAAAWAAAETWSSELYPTVTRCLGHGVLTAAASLGGMIMPFAVNLEDFSAVSFGVMGCLLLTDALLCYFTPETKDLELADTPVLKIPKAFRVVSEEIIVETRNGEQQNDNDTVTDIENSENTNSQQDMKTILEIVDEEGSDENSSDASEKETAVDNGQEEHSLEVADTKSKKDKTRKKQHKTTERKSRKHFLTSSPSQSPKIKVKSNKKENEQTESKSGNHLMETSPRPSPAPSPKIKDKSRKKEHEIVESKSGKHLGNPSPRPSPAPSPKIKDKLRRKEHEIVESKGEYLVNPSPQPSPAPSPGSSPKIKAKALRKEQEGVESKSGKHFLNQSPRPSPAPSPKIKDKAHRKELDVTESKPGKHFMNVSPRPSPDSSPAPSPKRKRLDKLRNSELLHGKIKSKPKDDSPPYIESSHNKNVRFSIY
ncbi:hypothetical protein BsWGS_13577 [Bradybaena similaris]